MSRLTTDINDTGGKFAAGVNCTSSTFLPIVSKTPVANNGNNIRVLTAESDLKAKIYLYCMLTILPKVSLSCEYLRKFSIKFETALMVYSGAWGNVPVVPFSRT
jgi:hypothetical protein